MFTRWTLPILLAGMLLAAGCTLITPTPEDEGVQDPPRALTAAEQHLAESDNRFGLKLFQAMHRAEPDENVFISPLSVSMALGMTLNGAAGDTYADMQRTLELAGLSRDEVNAAYRSLIDLLEGLDRKVVFEIANSIWYRQGFSVEQPFIDVNRQFFDAEVRALDFSRADAPATINRWVDEKTHGKIEEIIDRIGSDVVMYLVNAIYFKGVWTYEFSKKHTQDDVFRGADGTTAPVKMMRQEATLPYFETEAFQAVDLPYGDSLYSMTVLLPRPGASVDAVADALTRENWDRWTASFAGRVVNLQLPRFKLEYKTEMKDVLSALGMASAFDPVRADFTRINAAGGLYISRVLHKTFVEVNEEGTEAAAVTAVEIRETSAGPDSPVLVRVDRPFVFAIRERHSGTILFIGKVMQL